MQGREPRRKLLLMPLAGLFAAWTLVYGITWMYAVRQPTAVRHVAQFEHSAKSHQLRVLRVAPDSAAAQAGLVAGDRVVAVDGRPLPSLWPYVERIYGGAPGETLLLSLDRGGPAPLEMTVRLEPRGSSPLPPPARSLAFGAITLYPIPFMVVGLGVLFLRLEDRNAWLLALLFAGFIASAPLLPFEPTLPAALRGLVLAYKILCGGLVAGTFLWLFSEFPARTPLDRRFPWLKWLWLGGPALALLPLSVWALGHGRSELVLVAIDDSLGLGTLHWLNLAHATVGYAVGLSSLLWNATRAEPTEARRRGRVIVWGTTFAVLPGAALQAAAHATGHSVGAYPFWIWAPAVLALFLFPLSFAYAIVKHRVLEIPVLLRRSARYLLVQRGFFGLLLVVCLGVTLLFATTLAGHLESRTRAALPLAIALGVAFGTLLLWLGGRVQRHVRERVDRAFFRSAYDAQHILQDLAARTRRTTDRGELARLMESHVRNALLPRSLTVYLRSGEDDLLRAQGQTAVATLDPGLPLLGELTARARSWELPWDEAASETSELAPLDPECLVPMLGRDGRLGGLLVLGPRLSEEPYSGEDKRLLDSVASQAGLALESLGLAEQMAVRLEAERRSSHEMALAKQVQVGLLPREAPRLQTLECAGDCLQTRAVGGDYYDFLDVEPGRLGLVLADISGKGFPAALLMASLQASLRSRPPQAFQQLPEQLLAVNQLLYRYSAPNRFATLFFGLYDDERRSLSYANCGHNPPLLLRADGSVEELQPTAMVLGLLEPWECGMGAAQLGPGDLLAVFSDGVTEAFSDDGEEYGEARLLEKLRQHPGQPLAEFLQEVIDGVQRFSGSEQEDDLTLVLARGV